MRLNQHSFNLDCFSLHFYIPLVVLGLTFFGLSYILKGRVAQFAMDYPNGRSLHSVPVPRTGGLVVSNAVILGWLLLWDPSLVPIACGTFLLTAASFLDDLRGVSVGWRLAMHFLSAGIFLIFGLSVPVNILWSFVLAMYIVWMSNLYNFMDGSDGMAGGMALFGFGSYAIAAWLAGDVSLAIGMACIVTAACAFLYFNFHPARVFMGDAGSIPLGFMAGAFGVTGWQHGDWELWFPLLVFSPFVIDATVTLFKRVLSREEIWQAHRTHYYQRLVQMGLGHRKTAILEYCLMSGVGISAIFLISKPIYFQLAGLGVWGAIYVFFALWIDRLWHTHISSEY